MKTISLSVEQWNRLKAQLLEEYPKSVVYISYSSRRVLGFSVREHHVYKEQLIGYKHISEIKLDFYDEVKQTVFMLKYSEFL